MKIFFSLFFFIVAHHSFASTPIERMVPVKHVYSPLGFDNNDRLEVIIEGVLPNLCHRSPMSKVKVEGMKIKIELTSLYYAESSPFCPKVELPFVETVKIGVMDKGVYQIIVNEGLDHYEKSNIKVSKANSHRIDDFTYAGVDYIEKSTGSKKIILRGYNPSDCFELEEIKWVSNGKDTLSLLPIVKKVGHHCPLKMVPFEYPFTMPDAIDRDKILLHVRSMDGRSYNSLYYKN